MNLYIQIRNGQPFEHPIMEDNFRDVFPHININNLPPEFAVFKRTQAPVLTSPENRTRIVDHSYELVNGIAQDTWSVRDMTELERQERIESERYAIMLDIKRDIVFAESELAAALPEDKQVWLDYITVLNGAIEALPTISPYGVVPPSAPRKDANGQWISINSRGSAPNVIG